MSEMLQYKQNLQMTHLKVSCAHEIQQQQQQYSPGDDMLAYNSTVVTLQWMTEERPHVELRVSQTHVLDEEQKDTNAEQLESLDRHSGPRR